MVALENHVYFREIIYTVLELVNLLVILSQRLSW